MRDAFGEGEDDTKKRFSYELGESFKNQSPTV